ncbi:uncharacterized protein LOC121729815 [Aricia agestis]|uniref:uncharacterized protein LOC121729815 n=1 Tax=Aricia agestis TaxID=91739 RepID=UPI001C208517|nr:uncharacterized protein LOC121729815 [Aricia agestis]
MRVAVILAAILGCSLAVPVKELTLRQRLESPDVSTRNTALTDIINEVLDLIRELLIHGTGDIPPLDPLHVERINLDGSTIGFPEAYLLLEGLSVNGLSSFVVDELVTSSFLLRYTVNFDIRVPSVVVETQNYDMFVKIFGGEIFGNGDMKLSIVSPRVKGSVVVGVRFTWGGAYITIHDCNVAIGLESFEPVITGMFGNQMSSEFVSEFLKNLIPEIIDYFEDEISNAINTAVVTIGNDILGDLNLIDIIGDLLP